MRTHVVRLALLTFITLAVPRAGAAAVHVVTDFGDSGAPGQLRTLINAAAPGDTILIPPGLILLSGGDLDINKSLTIVGSSPDLTTIDAGGVDRAFNVFGPADAVLSGMTIRNGFRHPETGGGGGAIRNAATLRMVECVVEDSTSGGGGAVISTGPMTIESSTFRGNTASGTTGAGGAILNFFSTMTISSSTFSDNATLGPSASGNGGAISNAGTLAISNSTISGNSAFGHGGGIFQSFSGLTLALQNVTIAENTARLQGGGVMVMGATPSLVNTIAGANSAGAGGPDCSGTLSSQGHNLFGQIAGCTVVGDATGNVTGTPHLLPLADNGGPTFTHALRRASPALDGGSDAHCPALDQRGVTRPQDGNRDGTARCDIGAFEAAGR